MTQVIEIWQPSTNINIDYSSYQASVNENADYTWNGSHTFTSNSGLQLTGGTSTLTLNGVNIGYGSGTFYNWVFTPSGTTPTFNVILDESGIALDAYALYMKMNSSGQIINEFNHATSFTLYSDLETTAFLTSDSTGLLKTLNNTLDDGSGKMSLTGAIAFPNSGNNWITFGGASNAGIRYNTNNDLFLYPQAGYYIGFVNNAQNAWLLQVQDPSGTVKTKNNTLDDSSGNIEPSGSFKQGQTWHKSISKNVANNSSTTFNITFTFPSNVNQWDLPLFRAFIAGEYNNTSFSVGGNLSPKTQTIYNSGGVFECLVWADTGGTISAGTYTVTITVTNSSSAIGGNQTLIVDFIASNATNFTLT